MMVAELEKNGVTIATRAKVDEIIIANKRARGVTVNGTTIDAKAVISNSGITNTTTDLIDQSQLSQDFNERVNTIRVNNSSCQVYFGINEEAAIPPIGDLLFTSTAEEFDAEELLDFRTQSKTFSIYYPKTRPGHNRYTIVASMNARYDDWSVLSKDTYNKEKELLIQRTISDLQRYVPDIQLKLDWTEAATPMTFNRYTLHTAGTSFGTKFEGLDISRSLHKEIAGLFHVGSVGIIMSGWLGAINYGVIVANDADGYIRGAMSY